MSHNLAVFASPFFLGFSVFLLTYVLLLGTHASCFGFLISFSRLIGDFDLDFLFMDFCDDFLINDFDSDFLMADFDSDYFSIGFESDFIMDVS